MPRRPRVFVPGAIYHAYNRISSGEPVFSAGQIDALGAEQWGVRTGEMTRALGKIIEVVSRWVGAGTRQRVKDSVFREAYERLDEALLLRFGHGRVGVEGQSRHGASPSDPDR